MANKNSSFLSSEAVSKFVKWFEKNQRDFVWRKNPHPYFVWLAEVMSQQTQMTTLMPYFFKFTEKFKTVHDLASAPEEEVMKLWAGLGYYSRARNLHKCAKVLSVKGFPKTAEGWQELPGVGPYTAAAIASQSFGEAAAVFDGNVLRVCSRILKVSDAHTPAFKNAVLEKMHQAMPKEKASSFNQAFMELGATICTPKNPKCDVCVLKDECRVAGKAENYPAPKKRKDFLEIKGEMFVFENKNRVFLMPRKENEWFSGMYDFVSELGGVKKPIQKLALSVSKKEKVGEIKHSITHHKIKLTVYKIAAQPPKSFSGKWLSLDALCSDNPPVPVATTTKKALRLLSD